MTTPDTMTVTELYQHLRTLNCGQRRADYLVEQFHRSANFLCAKIDNEGWKWRDNYLREHAGCAFGALFTNTLSPYILELLWRKYPHLQKYRRNDTGPDLFALK